MSERALPKVLIGPWMLNPLRTAPDWCGRVPGADALGFGPHGPVPYRPHADTFQDLLDRLPAGWRPDLFVSWQPHLYAAPLGWEDAGVPAVAALVDWQCLGLFGGGAEVLRSYDAVFVDRRGAAWLRGQGIAPALPFLASSFESAVDRPDPAVARDIDVGFAGALGHPIHRVRDRFLARVADLSPRYRVQLAPWCLDRAAYARFLQRTRIVFNRSYRSEANLRFYEALAGGALAFLEEGNEDVAGHFTPGVHYVAYNEDTLVPLLERYLADEPARARIAAAGHAEVQRHRNADHLGWLVRQAMPLLRPGRVRPRSALREAHQIGVDFYEVMTEARHHALLGALARCESEEGGPALRQALRAAADHRRALALQGPGRDALLQSCLKTLASATAAAPDQAWPLYLMAELLRTGEMRRDAVALYRHCGERLRGGAAALRLVTAPAPYAFDWFCVHWLELGVAGDREGQVRLLRARCLEREAEALTAMGALGEALGAARAAAELCPEVGQLWEDVAWIASHAGDAAACAAAGEVAARERPFSPTSGELAARGLLALGRFAEARDQAALLHRRLATVVGYERQVAAAAALLAEIEQAAGYVPGTSGSTPR